jgi:hypothetical protein
MRPLTFGCRILFPFTILPFFAPTTSFCTERITFGPLRVYPDTEKNREFLEELVWRAARTVEDKYGQHTTVSASGSGTAPDFSVGITATLEKESEAVVVSMKREPDGDEPRTFSLLGGVSQESAGYLSGAVFYLWASFHGGLTKLMEDPPETILSLDTNVLSSTVFPGSPAMLVPTSVSAIPEGKFLCGFSLLCVEIDRILKSQASRAGPCTTMTTTRSPTELPQRRKAPST